MDQFLERGKLIKLTQGDADNLNSLMTFKEIELIINILPKKKHQIQIVSWVNFTKHLTKT